MAAKPALNANPRASVGMGIRTFVFILMLVGSLAPIALTSWLNYNETKTRILRSADLSLVKEAQSNAEQVSDWLDFNLRAMQAMASSEELSAMSPEIARPYMQRVQKEYPWFYAFFLVDPTGQQIARSDEGAFSKIGERQYFKRAFSGEPVAFQFAISKATNKPALLPGSPIRKPGSPEVLGVIGGGANMDVITDKITGGSIGKSGFSYLVSSENVILAHPQTDLIGAQVIDQTAINNLNKVVKGKTVDGKEINVVATPAGGQLVLISQIDTAEVEAPLAVAQKNAAIFLSFAVVLAALLSYALGNTLSSQINRISFLGDKLSKAQSTDEIKTIEKDIGAVKGTREIRSLGSSIQRLANSIKLALDALS